MTERKFTLKRDDFDPRDHLFARFQTSIELPTKVDLRAQCSSVVNQFDLGSCTANAIASGLKEYLMIKSGEQLVRLSRLYLYYKERESEGTIYEDAGATIRTGIKIMASVGCSPEEDWPYIVSKFTAKPYPLADQHAGQYKVASYQRLITLNDIKRCLSEGYPIVFGIEVFESFESKEVATTGIVPVPDTKNEKSYGGHAILIVGYEQTGEGEWDGHFIVRNSWGTEWGDKGYCYIPFEFMKKQIAFDFWTAR